MSSVLAVMKRELGAYFTRLLGYLYLMVFIVFTNLLGLFLTSNFFESPRADMRYYMHFLAVISSFFIAAATMRVWAEEKEQNTFEMLLTMPFKARHLVLGKFLATLTFYIVGVALTLTVPIMMIVLSRGGEDALANTGIWGGLDIGPTLCAYLAAILLGAMFVSFGLFVSSLCRDQTLAFVLTGPTMAVAYVIGFDYFKMQFDKLIFGIPGVGESIADYVGIYKHFDRMASGLLDLSDVLFFVIWIVVFLLLNGLVVEIRHRPMGKTFFALSLVILLGIGAAGNWLTRDQSLGRIDCTMDKKFTISQTSVEVLKMLKEPVTIQYIVTAKEDMPVQMKQLQQEVKDKLEALREASGGRINYSIVNPGGLNDPTRKASRTKEGEEVERRITDGIPPIPLQESGESKMTFQVTYSGLKIKYLDKDERVIPMVLPDIYAGGDGLVVLSSLEYNIINEVYKMVTDETTKVALVGQKPPQDPRMQYMFRDKHRDLEALLKQAEFEVIRTSLQDKEIIPEDTDVLVVVEPTKLTDEQLGRIGEALTAGVPTFIAAQRVDFDLSLDRIKGIVVTKKDNDSGINKLLRANGIEIGDESLLVSEEDLLPIYVVVSDGYQARQLAVKMPFNIEISKKDMAEGGLFSRISSLELFSPTPLIIDEKALATKKIKATPLIGTGNRCWAKKLEAREYAQDGILKMMDVGKRKPYTLMALFEGQFINPFASAAKKDAPVAESKNPADVAKAALDNAGEAAAPKKPGKLIVMSQSEMYTKGLRSSQNNYLLFFEIVSNLGMDDMARKINGLRKKQLRDNSIGRMTGEEKTFWQVLQLFGHSVLLLVIGVSVMLFRLQRRKRYAAGL